ncbi:MAG: class I SAM-dependent methyltransferase [Oceanicaulis sp.]
MDAMARTPAQAWDDHAADYARLFSPLTGYVGQTMVKMVEARLPSAAQVLDIACGAGDLALAAGRALSARGGGRVAATDFSPAMIALTQKAVTAAGLADVVECAVRDGRDLGFEDSSFDAAFSAFGIFLFPDRLAGWREAARMLKPGGLFATCVWRLPEFNELARFQMEAMMESLPARLTESGAAPDWRALMTREGLEAEICGAAPFVDAEVIECAATLAVPSAQAMWGAMQGNPVMSRLLGACTPEELETVKRVTLSRSEAHAGGPDRPLVLKTSCHILIARRG